MARGAVPLIRAPWPGILAGGAVLALTLGPLAAVAWRAAGGAGAVSLPGPADWAALRFTLWQAAVSASLSVLLAVPAARALARRQFPGRRWIIAAFGAPFILPVIVAVMGILAIFGRAGMLNGALAWLGLPRVSIYGPWGVVMAHVFFNLPLALRLILQGWASIPAERFRLAESLGFRSAEILRFLELPMLRAVLPGIWAAIFLICLSSFTVALTLGGGPRATTVELAIFQAFRFDFDLGRAAMLAGMQFAICLAAAAGAAAIARPAAFGAGLDRPVTRHDGGHMLLRLQDGLAIGLAALFVLSPVATVIAGGLPHVIGLPDAVWRAAARSVAVSMGATLLCLTLALALAHAALRLRRGAWVEAAGMLSLAASPLVTGTGLFILLRPVVRPADAALAVTLAVNAIAALPFALRAILPALRDLEASHGRLSRALGLGGLTRLRIVTLPRLRGPIGFAAGLTAAFSMGDLGVIALFASETTETLPLQLYRLMGAYRMDDAAGAAVVLLALSFGAFWIFDRGGRSHADT